jgi:hypothetical protein
MNNLLHIKPFLKFESDDHFYYLQILKRRKENPDLANNARVVKTYFVSSMEYLEENMGEIEVLCNYHNARAYINLNRRSFEKVARNTLRKITDQVVMNEDYRSVRKSYTTVCGGVQEDADNQRYGGVLAEAKSERKWVVDVDTKLQDELNCIMEIIHRCDSEFGTDKILGKIPTKHGYHLITKSFNLQQFRLLCKQYMVDGKITEVPDVQKNNPTILYMQL